MHIAGYGTLFVLIVLLASCSDQAPPPVVQANGETLAGSWEGESGTIAAFKGVPFAAPPLGDLRWRAPVPNTPRSGEQDASKFAAACMQTAYMTDWYARVAAAFGKGPEVAPRPQGVSEDCLYLNIWSPNVDPEAGLPVMVWVHGGSNLGGWSYEPNYRGERLAARDVVVVSIAYRLGPLGFFSHPALDNGSGQAVANFGLLDIREAFRWVRQNIQAFGGDPDKITGFGESAGAGDLLDLALAGADDEGLFRRVIAESTGGSLDGRRTLAQEQEIGERLVAALGIEGEVTARRLRDIPAQDLLAAAGSALQGHYFDAVIDGLSMVRQPAEALGEGRVGGLDLLIGTNADEWYMYIDTTTTEKNVDQWINREAPEFAGSLHSEIAGEPDPRKALDRLRTAHDTLCPSRDVAAAVSSQGGQGYVYYFSRARPGTGGSALGAYHGTELPYVFGTHDDWLPTEQADHALTDAVMDYWVQFARNGDPNVKGRPGWPVYTADRPWVMQLGEEIRVTAPNDADLCRYFSERFGQR